ncbi:ABC transporter substrate-binding protein [Paracidobacterium acidisoli]|nr:ABC transporter substrate-binding protein [Paracidobacterium acidisoli]MBT9331515.1 ABC transporter substrate-binding protein [Paracidobacterium acidisoli]
MSIKNIALPGPALILPVLVLALLAAVCSASSGDTNKTGTDGTVTITDMLGRKVTMPKTIHRVLALHPIPTGLLAILAPQDQVSIDSYFQRSLKTHDLYTDDEYKRLSNLPVTGVYFTGISAEQIIELHPDVVITMVNDKNIDREQQQTGIPFFAVSKAPTSSYETTIRLVGQIVGQQKRAGEMAGFWAETVQSVENTTAKTTRHPTVLYTGKNGHTTSVPGRNTVFGSTIDTAGGQSVGDELPSAFASNESNPVSMEQVVKWNPDIIIASGAASRNTIMTDPQWHALKAVQTGHVYAPRAFAGLDGLQAVLGMVWTQGVLIEGDDAAAEARLTSLMQSYYQLFYGHTLTASQIGEPAR